MNVVFSSKLEAFYQNQPKSKNLLLSWRKRIKVISPKHFIELKEFFQPADQVGELTVFNISSNYRLIAQINYESQQVIIRETFPYKDYELGKWKKQELH